jgi:hypothetical protein
VRDFYEPFFTEKTITGLQGNVGLLEQWLAMFAPVRDTDEFLAMVRTPLFGADSYRVTETIVRAVDGMYQRTAGNTLTLEPEDLPSPTGFAWFDYPVVLTDASGARLATRALSWGETTMPADFLHGNWPPPGRGYSKHGVRVSSWAHTEDIDDFTSMRARQEMIASGMPLSLSHSSFIPFGCRLMPLRRGEVAADDIIRWAHVLWMFMGTEVVTEERPVIERHFRRRAERIIKTGSVRVVVLRRSAPKDRDHAPRKVDWSCCWIVQQHWRHLDSYVPFRHHRAQFDRREGGPVKHCVVCRGRVTHIGAYVKGPNGLPLKSVPETLYNVSR